MVDSAGSTEPASAGPGADSTNAAPSLRRTAVRGVRLAFFGWSISQGLMFVAYLVLARLVSPAEFGHYTAASVITGVGILFAESGMMSALISRRDRIEEAASTAFFSLLVSGTLLTCGALAAAPLVGLFFHSRRVGLLSAALSGWLFFAAMTIVPDALLQRRFSFARRVAVDPAGSVAFGVVSIVACSSGAGAWGLVAGTYASILVQVVLAWSFARVRPRRRLASLSMWRELAAFARPVLGSEIFRRIAGQLDAIVLGRASGAAILGQYRNGLRLAQQPAVAVVEVGSYVLLPTFAHLAREKQRLDAAAKRVYSVVAATALPLGLTMLPLGVPIAVLLLGPRWRPAGHAIAGLCGLLVGGAIVSVSAEILKSLGRPRLLVRIHALNLGVTAVLVVVGALTQGLVGVAVALSLAQCAVALYAFSLVSPLIKLRIRALVSQFVRPAMATGPMLLAMYSFGRAVRPLDYGELTALALTIAEFFVGAVVYTVVLLAVDGRRRADARKILTALRHRLVAIA